MRELPQRHDDGFQTQIGVGEGGEVAPLILGEMKFNRCITTMQQIS